MAQLVLRLPILLAIMYWTKGVKIFNLHGFRPYHFIT
jgi:hypothetical protein